MSDPDFAFEHQRLRRFHDYWLGKCRPGRLPGRADIDPVDIPDLLPWMLLVDPVKGPGGYRFRVRLVGTAIVARSGRDSTGQWYDQIFPAREAERFAAIYLEVMNNRVPHHFHADYEITLPDGRRHVRYERLLCPLAADGITVDMLAGIVAYSD